MNKDKVYIEGYEVGFRINTLGTKEKIIQVANGEIVSIDERFIYKSIEREKVQIPQFVADFITEQKKLGYTLSYSIDASMSDRVAEWYWDNSEVFALAWILGYGVEKEKRYLVKVKGVHFTNYLISGNRKDIWFFHSAYEPEHQIIAHTRKELEEDGFGWVFDCPGIEIEEVE